jgi:type I restriction enzyme M protein
VPDTPHDLTKRERGQKYDVCGSADLVAFADDSGEWYALQVVFEFKAPDIDAGRSQLIRYLSNEPMAKMGFWTNGAQTLAVYKNHHSDWHFVENAPLPHPTDDLTTPPDTPPTWNTMRVPSEAELTGALKRLVSTVVVSDPLLEGPIKPPALVPILLRHLHLLRSKSYRRTSPLSSVGSKSFKPPILEG